MCSLAELIVRLCDETYNKRHEYVQYFDDNLHLLAYQMLDYFTNKTYDCEYCDILPVVVCNALNIKLYIVHSDRSYNNKFVCTNVMLHSSV